MVKPGRRRRTATTQATRKAGMPDVPRVRRLRAIPWRKVLGTITIFPSQLHADRACVSVQSRREALIAKSWKTVMTNLGIAWQVTKNEVDVELADQQQ